jgi:lysyl-tRNA synthetase class 1
LSSNSSEQVVDRLAPEDWVTRLADEVIAEAENRGISRIVCASGISPSGPIHLGNFRELITPHLVADEIKRRGVECEHLLSWDDFDRFRRVPKNLTGVDESWEEHIGKPLTAVPAPQGSPHPNWAEHFKAPLLQAMAATGIEVRQISQTEQYRAGAYREQILLAMGERGVIDTVLGRYRTLEAAADAKQKATGKGRRQDPAAQQKLTEEQAAAATEAERGSGAASEDDGSEGTAGYFPFKPFCSVCGTDFTTVTSYNDDTHDLDYTCTKCGHAETVNLSTFTNGKLVWKVDWPMRWGYEQVLFEPSGVDHQSPGSSFVVGKDLAPVFGWKRPIGPMYAFVGIAGMAKMSSSKGGVPIPTDALEVMEPQVLRWLYARRRPNQSFDVAFGPELQRLYDEWDALVRKVEAGPEGGAQPGDLAAHLRATTVATDGAVRELPTTPRPMPFRTIASVIDVTQGDEAQAVRILSELDPDNPVTSTDDLRPRLDCAERWMLGYVPAEDRTIVRDEPDDVLLAFLGDAERESLRLLTEGLDDHWSLDGLTHLVYAVPKIQRGIDPEAKVKDPDLSRAQREFFRLVYQLLVSKDTGPRLPTLLLAVGPDRTRRLLGH